MELEGWKLISIEDYEFVFEKGNKRKVKYILDNIAQINYIYVKYNLSNQWELCKCFALV